MIHSEIRCDGCGIVGSATGQVYSRWRGHVARDELRNRGWRVGEPGGKDYCPICVAQDVVDPTKYCDCNMPADHIYEEESNG